MSIRRLTPRMLARVDAAIASALGRPPSSEERMRAHSKILESLQRGDLLRLVMAGELLIRARGGILWLVPADPSDPNISNGYYIQSTVIAALRMGASIAPPVPVTEVEECGAMGWAFDAISDSFLAGMVVDGDLGIDPTANSIRYPTIGRHSITDPISFFTAN